MTPGGPRPLKPAAAVPEPPPAKSESFKRGLRGFLLTQLVGATFGRFEKLIGAVILGAAGVFLTVAWEAAPERALNRTRDAKLAARTEGRIVESWLAIELDPREMGRKTRWRAFARAAPCAVVEYRGDWGAPARRAFCGNRFKFSDEYTLHDLREMAPRIPFAWLRDESGFIVPEIRIGTLAREWLASHPAQWLLPNDPPAATALEGLRMQLDRPVDFAVAGWSAPPPTMMLALDAKHPESALPLGLLETRLHPNWVVMVFILVPGLLVWYEGMALMFGDLPKAAGIFMLVLPLFFLPWWSEHVPGFIRYLNKDFGGVIADMLEDVNPLGRVISSEPEAATLAGGERLIWHAKTGAYADTFGRFQYAPPSPAPTSDAAVALLAATVTDQTRLFPEEERIALFRSLERDKVAERRKAGIVFLPAAREAVMDGEGSVAVRRAAAGFLAAWFTQPMEIMDPGEPGHAGRRRVYATLTDLPEPLTSAANSARAISGQPDK